MSPQTDVPLAVDLYYILFLQILEAQGRAHIYGVVYCPPNSNSVHLTPEVFPSVGSPDRFVFDPPKSDHFGEAYEQKSL